MNELVDELITVTFGLTLECARSAGHGDR